MKTPLKICFPFVGDSVGGSHISASLLIKHLVGSEYEPNVVLFHDGALAEYLRAQGIKYQILSLSFPIFQSNFLKELRSLLPPARQLARFLKSNGIQLVHTNDLKMHCLLSVSGFFNWDAKFIWHQRTMCRSRRLGLYAKRANKIIAISNAVKDSLVGSMQKDCEIVANPFVAMKAKSIDRIGAKKELLSEFEAKASTIVIGFIGNLLDQKRPDVFLKFAKIISGISSEDELLFLVVGEKREPSYSHCLELLQDSLEGLNVRFLGHRGDISRIMSGMDLVIAPAVNEGFGRVLVESIMAGTPVLACDSGGHREILVDDEMLFEPDNVGDLVIKYKFFIKNRGFFLEKVRTYAESFGSSFSEEVHANAMKGIYRGLSNSGSC